MKTQLRFQYVAFTVTLLAVVAACNPAPKTEEKPKAEAPEFFQLRPKLENAYGYSHAVRIGDELKISGAVSMDSTGNLTAKGDLKQQMINCYGDLDKVLKHYGYTWNDVVVENILTTNMAEFEKQAGYRNTIYRKQFPAGSWFGVRELALPGQLIEIELEAHRAH